MSLSVGCVLLGGAAGRGSLGLTAQEGRVLCAGTAVLVCVCVSCTLSHPTFPPSPTRLLRLESIICLESVEQHLVFSLQHPPKWGFRGTAGGRSRVQSAQEGHPPARPALNPDPEIGSTCCALIGRALEPV